MVFVASLVYAAAQVGVVLVGNLALVVVLLLPAGAAWLAVLSTLGAATQVFLPGWVRARGLSVQQIVFMGGQAVGASSGGSSAQYTGLVVAFVVGVGAHGPRRGHDRGPAAARHHGPRPQPTRSTGPEPQLVTEPDPDEGPVLITVTFTVPRGQRRPFLEAMTHVRASRQRTGAARWSLYRDAADPSRFVEAFHVPSWDEHLRQHRDRLTGADQDIERRALALADGPPPPPRGWRTCSRTPTWPTRRPPVSGGRHAAPPVGPPFLAASSPPAPLSSCGGCFPLSHPRVLSSPLWSPGGCEVCTSVRCSTVRSHSPRTPLPTGVGSTTLINQCDRFPVSWGVLWTSIPTTWSPRTSPSASVRSQTRVRLTLSLAGARSALREAL